MGAVTPFIFNTMSTIITGNGNYLQITTSGIVRLTVPKKDTVVRVHGNMIRIDHNGEYASEFNFTDISSPITANIEALRVAIKNILNT